MTVRLFTSFAEVPSDLRCQLAYPAQGSFFLSFDWFQLAFETCMPTLTPRIYVLFDDEGHCLCALFCGQRGADRSLVSLGNFYTLQYGFSFASRIEARRPLIYGLVRHIAQERPRWDCIRFGMLCAGDEETGWLHDALRGANFGVYPFAQYENWHLPTSGQGFEAYFAERPSQLRNTISRKHKKLLKMHPVRVEILKGDTPRLGAAIRDFISIYNASWKDPEPFPEFIPELATRCARLGMLRLGILYVDERPAAAQLWITASGKAIIYKLAYVQEYAEMGVGSILSKELFRVALDEDRVDEIDYGVGAERYKRDWMTSVRTISGLEAYNRRSIGGLLLSLVSDAKAMLKKVRFSVQPIRRTSA